MKNQYGVSSRNSIVETPKSSYMLQASLTNFKNNMNNKELQQKELISDQMNGTSQVREQSQSKSAIRSFQGLHKYLNSNIKNITKKKIQEQQQEDFKREKLIHTQERSESTNRMAFIQKCQDVKNLVRTSVQSINKILDSNEGFQQLIMKANRKTSDQKDSYQNQDSTSPFTLNIIEPPLFRVNLLFYQSQLLSIKKIQQYFRKVYARRHTFNILKKLVKFKSLLLAVYKGYILRKKILSLHSMKQLVTEIKKRNQKIIKYAKSITLDDKMNQNSGYLYLLKMRESQQENITFLINKIQDVSLNKLYFLKKYYCNNLKLTQRRGSGECVAGQQQTYIKKNSQENLRQSIDNRRQKSDSPVKSFATISKSPELKQRKHAKQFQQCQVERSATALKQFRTSLTNLDQDLTSKSPKKQQKLVDFINDQIIVQNSQVAQKGGNFNSLSKSVENSLKKPSTIGAPIQIRQFNAQRKKNENSGKRNFDSSPVSIQRQKQKQNQHMMQIENKVCSNITNQVAQPQIQKIESKNIFSDFDQCFDSLEEKDDQVKYSQNKQNFDKKSLMRDESITISMNRRYSDIQKSKKKPNQDKISGTKKNNNQEKLSINKHLNADLENVSNQYYDQKMFSNSNKHNNDCTKMQCQQQDVLFSQGAIITSENGISKKKQINTKIDCWRKLKKQDHKQEFENNEEHQLLK